MKYLKKFADREYKYKLGDFVLLNKNYFVDKHEYHYGEIIEIDFYDEGNPYHVEIKSLYDMTMWMNDDIIIKKLTLEEVQKLKIEYDANKYNL